MRSLVLLAATLALAACATVPPSSSPSGPSREEAISAVATTAAAVADAANAAPPAAVTSRTTIDEKGVRVAYQTFDTALTVIDGFVATGTIKPGSPTALKVKGAILVTKDALNAASAAQRAGQATSYLMALAHAQAALSDLRSALAR